MEYFLILMGFLLLALFLEHKYHVRIYHSRKERIIITLHFFIIGTVWDYYATWRGHWVFPGPGLLGIRIFGLPIEEFLFFLIMPFLSITAYKIMDKRIK